MLAPAGATTASLGSRLWRLPPFRASRRERELEFVRRLARVLEIKRWQQRDEPFRGFGSPPGKF